MAQEPTDLEIEDVHLSDDAPEVSEEAQNSRPEPIGVVERELTRPDGTKVRVEVPVYPPYQLEGGSSSNSK